MEEIVLLVLQVLFELVFTILANVPFDLPFRNRTTPESDGIAARCTVLAILGGVIGWLSTLLFKHTAIPFVALRILNIVVAPLVAAFVFTFIASVQATSNSNIKPENHFWQAFWFTLGLVIMRFAFSTSA